MEREKDVNQAFARLALYRERDRPDYIRLFPVRSPRRPLQHRAKAVTGKEHLERNDFIIEKQKEEMKRHDATRQCREHLLEMANKKMQETESITNALIEKANEKERQSEDLDRAISEKRSRLNKEKGSELLNAAVGWATGKSKALKNEIEDLRCEISTHEETIERL